MPFEESGSSETTQVTFEPSYVMVEKPSPVLVIKNLSGVEYKVEIQVIRYYYFSYKNPAYNLCR